MLPGHRRQRLVGALENALRADVDPAARGHLAVHRQPAVFEIAEVFPGGPGRHQQRVCDQDAWRPGMRPEHRDRFARLHDQRLVVLEPAQRVDDGVEGGPAARGAPRTAVDDEIVGAFGDRGVEVVHQHAQRSFLRPPLAGDRRPMGRADLSMEGAHLAGGAVGGSNLKTYARVVKLKVKISYLTSPAHEFSSDPVAIIDAIRSMSGDGGRSSPSAATPDRTCACTRWSSGEVTSGASRSSAWLAHRISIATTRVASATARSALSAAPMLMLTWSSRLAEVGMVSTLAGWARVLISDARAAAVTWAIM